MARRTFPFQLPAIAKFIHVFLLPFHLRLIRDADIVFQDTAPSTEHNKPEQHGNGTQDPAFQTLASENAPDSSCNACDVRDIADADRSHQVDFRGRNLDGQGCTQCSGALSTSSQELKALLDPASHHDKLDALERRVARQFQLHGSRSLEDKDCLFSSVASIQGCADNLGQVQKAMRLMQQEGFCDSKFSILVADPTRRAVAQTLIFQRADIDEVRNRLQLLSFYSGSEQGALTQIYEELVAFIRTLLSPLSLGPMNVAQVDSDAESKPRLLLERACNALHAVLSLGLISYAGSHVSDLDHTIFGTQLEENQGLFITQTISLHRSPLACLGDLVGSSAWIFGPRDLDHEDRYWVSIDLDNLADLWGPAWAAPSKMDPNLYQEIYTERGTIYPVSGSPGQEVLENEIPCHWKPLSALAKIDRVEQALSAKGITMEESPQINAFSTLLIGKLQEPEYASSEAQVIEDSIQQGHKHQQSLGNLIVNEHCRVSIRDILEQRGEHIHLTGTSQASYESDAYQVSGSVSKIVSIGVSKTWKRTKGTMYKESILERCIMTGEDLLPILNLFVGLEVSHCTSNARRITFWEALRLANASGNLCSHGVGNVACLQSCWRFRDNRDRAAVNSWTSQKPTALQETIDPAPADSEAAVEAKMKLREVVVRAMARLEKTGVRNGTLEAWCPFTQVPYTVTIAPGKAGGHGWIHMLQESRDVCSFAVLSQACLTPPAATDLSGLLLNGCQGFLKLEARSSLQTSLYCVRSPTKKTRQSVGESKDHEFPQNRILELGPTSFLERVAGESNVLEHHRGHIPSITARVRTSNRVVVRELICAEIATRRKSSFLIL